MMVPRTKISLSAPGNKHLRLTQFVLKAITLTCLALSVTFWWVGTTFHKKIDALENQTSMISSQTKEMVAQASARGMNLSSQAIIQIPQRISFIKHVRDRVGFSWTQLLTDLESAVPKNLMMSTVSLDEKTNTVLLNGSTPSLKELTRLMHQLEKHQAFRDVILTQHAKKKKKKTGTQSFVVFSMKVSYEPTVPLLKKAKS